MPVTGSFILMAFSRIVEQISIIMVCWLELRVKHGKSGIAGAQCGESKDIFVLKLETLVEFVNQLVIQ